MRVRQSEIDKIRYELRSWSAKKREQTLARVHSMAYEEEVQIAVALFSVGWRPRRRTITTALAAPAMMILAMACFDFLFPYYSQLALLLFFPLFMLVACGSVVTMFLSRNEGTPTAAFPLLGWVKDERLVKPLLQSLSNASRDSVLPLQDALAASLPLLTEHRYSKIIQRERAILYDQIHSTHADLQTKTLNALVKLNDIGAISTVERFLKRAARSEIDETAEACLLHLQAVRESQRSNATLLRAAPETPPSNALLRAATANPEEEARQLLRPNDGC